MTQVCLRAVKSGLGGHDAGVWGSTAGSRTHLPSCENGDELPGQIMPPSVVMPDVGMKGTLIN